MAKKQVRPLQAKPPALARFGGGSGKKKDVQITGQDQIVQVVQPGQLDSATLALLMVNYEHHEIHSGSHYFYEDHVTLQTGEIHNIEITTPDTTKWLHMTFAINSPGPANFDVWEGSDASTGGTVVNPINNNRNSSNVSGAILKHDVLAAVPPGGLQIIDRLLGTDSVISKNDKGGTIDRDNEIILKQNTRYLFQLNSLANDNNVDFRFSWYEHTNKNS